MRTTILACVFLALTSCGSDDDGSSNGSTGGTGGASGGSGGATGGSGGSTGGTSATGGQAGSAAFSLTSSAYQEGGTIPQKYECSTGGGQNVSPPLAWTAGPSGTQSYAIVMRDLDYQNGFIHWVIWDIPATVLSLPENVEKVYEPSNPAGAKQAEFLAGNVGYFGPCSPNGVNTYELTLYAMPSAMLADVDQTTAKTDVASAIVSAALASTKLSGES